MDRPYMNASVDKLEDLLKEHRSERFVLAQLREELAFRKTTRAKQLLREVEGLLGGAVPMPPKPARPARLEDQLPLIESEDA
jgi:hypothetical protein